MTAQQQAQTICAQLPTDEITPENAALLVAQYANPYISFAIHQLLVGAGQMSDQEFTNRFYAAYQGGTY